MSDYMTMTTRHQHINTFDDLYGQEYVICASTSEDHETTLQHGGMRPECDGRCNNFGNISTLLYILATRPHQSQNV